MSTPWDARTYDVSSAPQQAWAKDVLSRLDGIAPDATVLDVGCGTGRVTESLLALVPAGRVLAIDADIDMVELARARLGNRADVRCQDVLELELAGQVDVVVSTAALHWVTDHERLWQRLARALRPAGILEVQCGGAGNIAGVREVIENVARDTAPELVGWSPWEFATPEDTERPAAPSRLRLDPMLAAGPADLPAERGAIRTNVDPGTPGAPPRGTT